MKTALSCAVIVGLVGVVAADDFLSRVREVEALAALPAVRRQPAGQNCTCGCGLAGCSCAGDCPAAWSWGATSSPPGRYLYRGQSCVGWESNRGDYWSYARQRWEVSPLAAPRGCSPQIGVSCAGGRCGR